MDTRNRTADPVAIGIDLGSSKCCVAAVRDGRAHVLENEFGQRTTPSWVAFNSQQRLVGGAALDQAVVNCANTVSGVKRTLGRTYDDVKGLSSPCKIVKSKSDDSFQYSVNYRQNSREFHPEQITAMILTNVKKSAEASLGCEVDSAVISVPASYSTAQRVAVKTAAKIAGLEVLQLINETTAAGIAFENNRTVTWPTTIAVVDFGAGKFDVSIMRVSGKSINVVAAAGSPYLGGYDLDEILVDYCVQGIRENYPSAKIDDNVLAKLRLACEEAKITLSLLPETRISVDFIVGEKETIILHRDDFIRLIKDKIRETIVKKFEVLFRNKIIMNRHNIDKVVLVGGSTRIPAVKSILEEYFGSHKLDQTVNQDEAVAQGAALRAAALSGAATGIEVTDVSSFSIGYYEGKTGEALILVDRFTPSSSKRRCRIKGRHTGLRFFERTYLADGRARDTTLDLTLFDQNARFSYVSFDVGLRVNESGLCSFSFFFGGGISKVPVDPCERPDSDVRRWAEEEQQLQQEAELEMKHADAKFELESLYSEVKSAVCDLKQFECKSSDDFFSGEEILNVFEKWMTKHFDFSNVAQLSQITTDLRSVKKKVLQALDAEQKKALEKAKSNQKHSEMKMIADKKSAFESCLSEVVRDLEVSDLVKHFRREQLELCKAKLCSLVAWGENIESASLTEVSQKLEELNQVEHEVDQMKESAAARKVFESQENFAFEMFDFEFDLSEVMDALDDSKFVNCSRFQALDSCKAELRSLEEWKENVKMEPPTQISLNLEELHRMKNKLDLLKAEAARLKALLEEEDDVGTTLESSHEQPTNTEHFCKSECPETEERSPRDVDLNSNDGMDDLSENKSQSPASSYNNSSGPVESSNESNGEQTDEVRSTSKSPPAVEEMDDRSNATQLSPSSEECVSDLKPQETQTHSTAESASTQTDVTSPEDGLGVGGDAIPGAEGEHQSEKEAELVKKFKDMGVYLPWLEVMENVMSNIGNCERCLGLKVVCCDHRCQAFQEVSQVLNSVIEVSIKSSK